MQCQGCGRRWSKPYPGECPECGTALGVKAPAAKVPPGPQPKPEGEASAKPKAPPRKAVKRANGWRPWEQPGPGVVSTALPGEAWSVPVVGAGGHVLEPAKEVDELVICG